MSSSEVNIVAIILPRKGKTQRVLELVQDAAVHVEKNEKDTHRYEMYSTTRPGKDGTDTICMVERYKNMQAVKEHGESAPFKKFQQGLAKEDLLLAPPTIHLLSRRGGFSSRL